MHHKLLASRMRGDSEEFFGRGGEGPIGNATKEEGTAASDAKDNQRGETKGEKHVPLSFSLAKIVSLELASDEEGPSDFNKSKKAAVSDGVKNFDSAPSSTVTKKPKPHPLERPVLLERKGAPLPPPPTQSISYTPSPALLAARMAEEQEALALYLRQRQQSSLQIELEQIRRMQTAMFLYQHTTPAAASLPYLESLVAGRVTAAKLAGDMFPRHPQGPAVSSNTHPDIKPEPVAAAASASGANPGLLSLAPKHPLDALKEKPIKERPEEYQHLSKKARRAPVQITFSGDLEKASPRPDDDDSSATSDSEKNGHRFRPYQYEQWTEKFQELCDFRKKKGHCQVPHTYKDNPPLARWVKRQRYQYKLKVDGKMSTMTDERVTLLENIGFIWDSHAAAWAEKLHELKDYARLRGDCNVPSTYPENPQLATWVKCQRRQYKLLREGKASNMTVDRIMELEKVGFVWEVRKTWEHTPDGMERVVGSAVVAASS